MEELQVKAGDIVASKYRVEKVLGVGGMGVVVAAKHVALGNLVAIKMMQPRAFGVKGAAERFLREGQAAAQLSSPHVAKVLDVGQLDSGAPYMIMEHLSGSDLATVIEKKGPVPLHDAVEYLLQACDAISEAHAKGIVHRDLKPANLFLQLSPDGSPLIKVLDFGIAKVAGSDQNLTGTSQGMGSGGYMSPEQMSSAKKVDHRADIWALGIALYELLTAHLPFAADSLEQFVARVFFEQPTPLLQHRPDLPVAVEAIVLRCLEKQPDARYPTVADLAIALSPYAPPRAQHYVERIARHLGVSAPVAPRAATPGTMLIPAQTGAPTGPTPGHATGPTAGLPTAQTASHPTGPGLPLPQHQSSPSGPGMAVSQPSLVAAAPGLSASQAGMASAASLPNLPPHIAAPAPAPSSKTGILVAIGAVVVIGIAAVVGFKMGTGRSGAPEGTTPSETGQTSSGATTAATVTPPPPADTATSTVAVPPPAAPPSGAPAPGASAKNAAPAKKAPSKVTPSSDPGGTKPLTTVR